MNLRSYLEEQGIPYQWMEHPTAYTAQDLAAVEHVSGKRVIKPVVVKADGQFMICALPAASRVDLQKLRDELRVKDVRLAEEEEIGRLFQDAEIGAEPPIGRLYGIPTIMDESLFTERDVVFQAGTHRDAVAMNFSDYYRVTQPMIGHFSQHA